jgi:hypothetical protein
VLSATADNHLVRSEALAKDPAQTRLLRVSRGFHYRSQRRLPEKNIPLSCLLTENALYGVSLSLNH